MLLFIEIAGLIAHVFSWIAVCHALLTKHDPRAALVKATADEVLASLGAQDQLLDLAKQLGATDVINPNDFSKPIQEVIVEMTDGGGGFFV